MVADPTLDQTLKNLGRRGQEADGPEAVSYTHLDVYKRQAQC